MNTFSQICIWAGVSTLLGILLQFVIFWKKKQLVVNTVPNLIEEPAAPEQEVKKTKGTEAEIETKRKSQQSEKSEKFAKTKKRSVYTEPWIVKALNGTRSECGEMDFFATNNFETIRSDDSRSPASPNLQRRRRSRDKRRQPQAPPAPPPPPRLPPDTLAAALAPHILSPERMWALGYPMELETSRAVVYISRPPRAAPLTFDVNAPEFIPGASCSSDTDSGRGSGGSSPRSDSDEETDVVELTCARCDATFRTTKEGEHISRDRCHYHWGRQGPDRVLTCCGGVIGSRGCDVARLHVWSGTRPGMNGPLEGYARARTPRGGVYAVDTEMCYTRFGLELASVCVVGADGRVVYRSIVKPSAPVIDHNTRFSGIRPRDLERASKTLRDVQNDILGFVGCDTILIGHALENDLRALKLLHGVCVDTCALWPHARGLPWRRSLRQLSSQLLGRAVQQASHSPLEDARAALDLALLRAHSDASSA